MIVYGASGHGKVVADAALAGGREIRGFIDDAADKQGATFFGFAVLGGLAWLHTAPPQEIAWGIGDNTVRQRLATATEALGHTSVTVIHPRAVVSPYARLGTGVVVMANACINPDACVEEGVIVNTGAIVEHDCLVHRFAHLSPNAALGGGVTVGARAHFGVGSSAIPLVNIGEDAVIGAGAVVVCDVPARVIAYGVPARVRRAR